MTRNVWVFFLGFVVLSGLIAAYLGHTASAGFADGTSVITFVTLVAVGIERLIEMCWTLLGQAQRFGGWWPLNQIASSVATVEQETNKLLAPVFETVRSGLESAKATLKRGDEDFQRVEAKLMEIQTARENLQARLDAAQTLAPGSPRFALTTHVAADAARLLGDAANLGGEGARAARQAVDKAAQAASIATTIVSSFGDNPARRIASILLGAGAGMLVAGFMGLNLFRAVLGQDAGLAAGIVGVLMTGIVMGLGSSPTHELIKSLQDYKESHKQDADASLAPTSSIGASDVVIDSSDVDRFLAGRQLEAIAYRPTTRVRSVTIPMSTVPIRSTD